VSATPRTDDEAAYLAAMESVIDTGSIPNGSEPTPAAYHFAPYAEFATQEFPDAEPLLGRSGKHFLAVGSLLVVYGGEGSAKTTWTIDGLCHLMAGRDWLAIPVPRPVRCLLIENEGAPKLFQAALDHKAKTWDGPDFTANLDIYARPWGEFSFASARARRDLTDYCEAQGVELVAANPTLGLGAGASGRPDETTQFVGWLRECGLWSRRAFWLLHHENKAGQISGDWGRHPDTKVLLQRDGNRQRTKLTWEKVRWATLDHDERALMLAWEVETRGYRATPLDTVRTSDELLVERMREYLTDHPASATSRICESVEGTDSRIEALLKSRPEFDFARGPHNAKLWVLASSAEGQSW
jgi:hypothetical protein